MRRKDKTTELEMLISIGYLIGMLIVTFIIIATKGGV